MTTNQLMAQLPAEILWNGNIYYLNIRRLDGKWWLKYDYFGSSIILNEVRAVKLGTLAKKALKSIQLNKELEDTIEKTVGGVLRKFDEFGND